MSADDLPQGLAAALRIEPDPEFLHAVYHTAVTPESYDELMALWQKRLEAAVAGLDAAHLAADSDTDLIDLTPALTHFQTSLEILDRLGRASAAQELRIGMAPEGLHVSIDTEGRIVWLNARAARLFRLRAGHGLERLPLEPTALARLRAALSGMEAAARIDPLEPPRARLVSLTDEEGGLHHLVAVPMRQPDGTPLMVLRSAAARWSPLLSEMLRDGFGLSDSELDIVAMLVEGLDLPEIATARDRQLSTVRTQLKTILRKTGTRAQARLMRLVLGLAAHLPASASAPNGQRDVHFLELACGRRMPFHRIGPARGRPVLYLHGMLDGIGVTEALEAQLRRHGVQLIAPERPFFGSAPGIDPTALPPGSSLPRDAVRSFADDLRQLCDHLRLDEVAVIGHMAGALYGFGFAAEAGPRVRALINVAGAVPITSSRQFGVMSARQRLVAYTARYTPTALPFILRAGIRQIDSGGERRFIEALQADSPRDRSIGQRPEVFDILRDGVRHAVAQGYRAFEIDSYHVVRDWSGLVAASTCPVHLLHGRHDPVVSCESVEGFATRLGSRATLQIAEDAGQLVWHAQPELVISTVARALDSNR